MVGVTAGTAYEACLRPPNRKWFGLADCFTRWALPFLTYYFLAVTQPITFMKFAYGYNKIWYCKQPLLGWVLTLSYPLMPFVLMLIEVYETGKRAFQPPPEDTASKLWFSVPPSPISAVLWQSGMNVSRMVSLFIVSGNHPEALEHVIYERLTTKDFWRGVMTKGGCRVPRQLGRWSEGKLEMNYDVENTDVVFKLQDAFFGIGDQFLVNGRDFSTKEDLEKILRTATYKSYEGDEVPYKSKEVLLLEYCRPPASLGVHSMDVLTVATPEGVKVLTCLYWGECTGASSHSTTAGYVVDVEREEIVGPCRWYAPYFATASDKLVGTKLPGVRKACEQAIAAHSHIPHRWMGTVGWDCMILKSGEVVFFEGNFGSIRIPRRIFLTLGNVMQFIRSFLWPFVSERPVFEPATPATSASNSPTGSPSKSSISTGSPGLRKRIGSSDEEDDRLAA
eukprot:Hpha_TRINITY_DN3684_c0_g1::TRINITY_DN3684_c0_g1_i1::g.1063::m.1063